MPFGGVNEGLGLRPRCDDAGIAARSTFWTATFLASLSLIFSGCLTSNLSSDLSGATPAGTNTRFYLREVYDAWAQGRHPDAVNDIQKALAASRTEKVEPGILVEVYDDAGLYHHLTGNFEASLRHQSVAVLLSQRLAGAQSMERVFRARLDIALESAGVSPDSLTAHADAKRLLKIPEVCGDFHIQRVYGSGACPD